MFVSVMLEVTDAVLLTIAPLVHVTIPVTMTVSVAPLRRNTL